MASNWPPKAARVLQKPVETFVYHSNIINISDSFLLESQTEKLLNAIESNNNQRYSIDSGKGFSHNCLLSDKSLFEDEVFFEKMKSESLLQKQNVFTVSNCNKLVKNSICNNKDSKSAENITETNIIIKTCDLSSNLRRHSNIKWYDDNVSLTLFSDKSTTDDDNCQLNSNSNSVFSIDSGNICDNEVELQTDSEKNSITNSSSSNKLISKINMCEKNLNTSATNFILMQSPLQEFTKLMSQNKEILTSTPISNISHNRHKSMLENMIRSCHSPNYSSASSSDDCILPTPPKILTLRCSNQSEIYTNISACVNNKYSMCRRNEIKYIDFNNLFTEEIESSISKNSHVYEKIYLSSGELLQVIDVGNNYKLFKKFLSEWKKKTKFSFCLICEKIMYNHCLKGIGCNMQKETNDCYSEKNNVVGICVYWNNRNIFYLPFSSNEIDYRLTTDEKVREVQHILEFTERKRIGIAFDIKEQYKVFCKKHGILLDSSGKTKWQDPKIADWLLDSGTKEKSLQKMVNSYLPQNKSLLDVIENSSSVRSQGLIMNNSNKKHNAAIEAFLCFHLMDKLFKEMEDRHLTKAFTEIEMPTLLILGKMELNGLGFDSDRAEQFQQTLQNHLQKLTDEAHNLAKHKFSLNSPQEISKVLFKELKLTLTDKLNNKIRKTVQHQSTAKQHLLKLRSLHPLPDIILEWRKTNLALYKVVFPLLRKKTYTHYLDMIRLYSHCDMFTITGRINMFEPSLQTIPRDFDIKLFHDNDKTSSIKSSSLVVSLRRSFIPFKGALFLASDFSQLEIRLLAHLSNDQKLINLLNSGGDVFKIIASQWKNTNVNNVSDLDRQHAKQICYGMIYGIGIKALSDQLDMEEEKASSFMETFKATYPGIKKYTESVVNACRKHGFVETLYGRRRYLPSINSVIAHVRAKTERQAINTIIQGSAADLIKIAMIKINEKMEAIYPETKRPHQYLFSDHKIQEEPNRSLLRGGYLVLELHDELIYEVQEEDIEPVYAIVKEGMESAVSLSVKLPVKIRVGSNWGDMKEWAKR
ncbi:DNA polymerase theta-like [Centruroides sculpturatus]|uniref:DNA polymerase theta-like n=1 Tax=Centruroides sculpturatus TaxID=218467 RepID=UPI000C6DDE50|nr:DNA polymerase theta-like [Centruroides sculpturatus]